MFANTHAQLTYAYTQKKTKITKRQKYKHTHSTHKKPQNSDIFCVISFQQGFTTYYHFYYYFCAEDHQRGLVTNVKNRPQFHSRTNLTCSNILINGLLLLFFYFGFCFCFFKEFPSVLKKKRDNCRCLGVFLVRIILFYLPLSYKIIPGKFHSWRPETAIVHLVVSNTYQIQ